MRASTGISEIKHLEAYTGLKVLWLEGNCISKIANLDKQVDLRCLYLHQNVIETLENLEHNVNLDTLNVSQNFIARLQGLASCTKLNTLQAAANKLATADSIRHLLECPSLSIVDLSNNQLEEPEVLDVLASMEHLRVLSLTGNPIVGKTKNYRKTVISRCQQLNYLDDRPVFDDEKRTAIAWARGGRDAEIAERQAIKDEKEAERKRQFESFEKLIQRSNERARAAGEYLGEEEEKEKEEEEKEETDVVVDDADVPALEEPSPAEIETAAKAQDSVFVTQQEPEEIEVVRPKQQAAPVAAAPAAAEPLFSEVKTTKVKKTQPEVAMKDRERTPAKASENAPDRTTEKAPRRLLIEEIETEQDDVEEEVADSVARIAVVDDVPAVKAAWADETDVNELD